jgi:hypothetical protein
LTLRNLPSQPNSLGRCCKHGQHHLDSIEQNPLRRERQTPVNLARARAIAATAATSIVIPAQARGPFPRPAGAEAVAGAHGPYFWGVWSFSRNQSAAKEIIE